MTSTRPKIKVLRIINRFNLGGPTFNAAYLSKYLDDRFETLLIGGMKDESEASSEFIVEGLGIQPIIVADMRRSISLNRDWKAYRKIQEIIRQFQPDIVHTHASKAGMLGRLAAFQMRVPIVVHTFHGHVFHSYFGTLQTAFYKTLERALAARSTQIVAISGQQKHEIGVVHGICAPEKITVIPLGFDLQRFREDRHAKRRAFREKYGLSENDVAIGIVGRLVPVKNHDMFLRVAKRVLESTDAPVRFFVVGDGESREHLLEVCQDLGLLHTWMSPPSTEKPVVFTSWIKEVDEVCAGMDIITLCSFNEGTPVSLIEAQSAARPIVSTRVGGIGDIVLEGESALLCDVDDDRAMADHLLSLIASAETRSRMGTQGESFVMDRFSYHRLVRDVEALYLNLIDRIKK